MNINREDMLELTRRMTLKRNCFSRIAGAYFDEEGFVDGTFNVHFMNLKPKDQEKNLEIAKAIPFAKTNEHLKAYDFKPKKGQAGDMYRLLTALKECELKNDALLDVFYEIAGEKYRSGNQPYAIYFYYGSYDVPLKASDKESLWESEEVFEFIICTISPVFGDYEAGLPECGFMFPAFTDRSSDAEHILIYQSDRIQLQDQMLNLIPVDRK